jgi:hypothetical protein
MRKFTNTRSSIIYVYSIALSVMLVTVLAFFPFENLYTTFESPMEAYSYFHFGKADIKHVVNGTNCDLVIGDKDGANRYLIIPKTEDGWKVGIGIDTKRIIQKLCNGIVIYVYQYEKTNDYFITVLDTNGGSVDITDRCNSEFYPLKKSNQTIGKEFVTYYAHISDFDGEYWISINGTKIEEFVVAQ